MTDLTRTLKRRVPGDRRGVIVVVPSWVFGPCKWCEAERVRAEKRAARKARRAGR